MSIEAMVWALTLAPVPLEEKGRGRLPSDGLRKPQPSSSCAFVLVALANHAGPDGRNAFPSVERICGYTRLGERTVQHALERLESHRIIHPSDPDIVAAHIKRADRRPNGWDLAMDLIRDDLTDEQLRKIGHDSPFLAPAIEAHIARRRPAERGAVVSDEDRDDVTGCSGFTDGVQSFQRRGAVVSERGAVTAPEPYREPSLEPAVEPPDLVAGDSVVSPTRPRGDDDPPEDRPPRSAQPQPRPRPAPPPEPLPEIPPERCPEHLAQPTTAPCRACGDARKAHDRARAARADILAKRDHAAVHAAMNEAARTAVRVPRGFLRERMTRPGETRGDPVATP